MLIPKSYLKLVKLVEKVIEAKLPPVSQALQQASVKLHLSKNLLLHLLSIFGLFICAVTCFAQAIRYFTTYFYPAFCTIDALATKNEPAKVFWLKYWAVFGFLEIFETATDSMIGGLPFYSVAKAGLVFWLYAPIEGNGANYIYESVLLPGMELVKTNSLDTLGLKVLDSLGHTLKLQVSNKGAQEMAKQLQVDVAQALVDNAVNVPAETFADTDETGAAAASRSNLGQRPPPPPPSPSPSTTTATPQAEGSALKKASNQVVIDPTGKPVDGAAALVVPGRGASVGAGVAAAASTATSPTGNGPSPSTMSNVFGTKQKPRK